MAYLAFIIPVIFVLGGYFLFKHKLSWIEALGQLIVPALFILIFKGCAVQHRTNDTEYWNTTITKAEYYEAWDEWIDETCEDCTTDDDGNTECTTYDCSYRDYHSAYWQIVDNRGSKYRVSESEFNRLVKKFGNKKFVDMHRDYDLNDGDKYVASWDGSDEDLEICVTRHTYENRPQAANSVFNYPEVPKEDIKQYDLYEYPGIVKYQKQDHLLGMNNKQIEHKLNVLNAKLGPKKQLKLFVLLFYDKQRIAGQMQEWYWKGGNKNEFIVAIGVDKNMNVQWCHPFSWTEAQQTKINTRTFIEEQDKLDLEKTVDFLYDEMNQRFVRKQFSEFNYLAVELTDGQVKWLYIITFILSLILTAIFVLNDFDSDSSFNQNDWRYRNKRSLRNTFHWQKHYNLWDRFNNFR
jgi:Ca2+/Na+ antiporter